MLNGGATSKIVTFNNTDQYSSLNEYVRNYFTETPPDTVDEYVFHVA
jgi:hypothetical protein